MNKGKKLLTSVANILLPIFFALCVGGVFILFIGKNPLQVYGFLVQKSLLNVDGFLNTLAYATPLIMTGLAIAIAFKAGIFNMGVEGQLYFGAFFAAYLGFTISGIPSYLHIPICILGGMAAGMAFALIPALLKAYFHVNEMVSTMMLNYVAMVITKYLTNGPFTANIGYPATDAVYASAELPRFVKSIPLTIAFPLALVIVYIAWVIYKKMKLGYEIEAIGKQVEFADAVGMRVSRKIIMIFLISGAISGIAGATEILGIHYRFVPSFSTNPGLGWDGMLVALLGANEPFTVLIAAIFFGALKFGGTTMQTFVGVPNDVINIIQGTLILFLSVRFIKKNAKAFGKLGQLFSGKKKEPVTVADQGGVRHE